MKEKKARVKKPFFKSPLKITISALALGFVLLFIFGALIPSITSKNRFNKFDQMQVLASMDPASFTESGEGCTFTSHDGAGNPIRFYGEGISLVDGGMQFEQEAFLCALDSVGAIEAYFPDVTEISDPDTLLDWGGCYTFSAEKTGVDDYRELLRLDGFGSYAREFLEHEGVFSIVDSNLHPNFVYINNGSSEARGGGTFTIRELTVYYDEDKKTTPLGSVQFEPYFYGYHLEGAPYDLAGEGNVDLEKGILDFYLLVAPDNGKDYTYTGGDMPYPPITCPDKGTFTVGALRDSAGNEVDKTTALMEAGMTLDITIGDTTVAVDVPTVPRFSGAKTLSELAPYANADALGEVSVLAVPVCWADETHRANEEALGLYRKNLGRVFQVDGTVKDYSDPNDTMLSMSEYFDLASYGKYTINTVMTDWYMSGENFAEIRERAPDLPYGAEILTWVKETYPQLDWTQFDRDSDGYVDALVLINAGEINPDEGYTIISMGGAIHYRELYNGANAGTSADPTVNAYVTINQHFLETDGARTLIHELGHNFGLIDYYDVYYTGINAVGGYDMQSDNFGDWNAYSKYAVGWLEPEVVTGLSSGESVDITIGASALTDEAIIIPAATSRTYDGTPFSEYLLVDLFTDKGAHQFDAVNQGLNGVTGVRIYHVNAMMELHVEEANGTSYDIGTPHYVNAYESKGQYHMELIQQGGENTFTDLDDFEKLYPLVSAQDFFYAGDSFRMEDYEAFFLDGKMDEGIPFGYTIEVLSITNGAKGPEATIRITAE